MQNGCAQGFPGLSPPAPPQISRCAVAAPCLQGFKQKQAVAEPLQGRCKNGGAVAGGRQAKSIIGKHSPPPTGKNGILSVTCSRANKDGLFCNFQVRPKTLVVTLRKSVFINVYRGVEHVTLRKIGASLRRANLWELPTIASARVQAWKRSHGRHKIQKPINTGYAWKPITKLCRFDPFDEWPFDGQSRNPSPFNPSPRSLLAGRGKLYFVFLTQGAGRPENRCRKRTS
jgi:hypothetical protein